MKITFEQVKSLNPTSAMKIRLSHIMVAALLIQRHPQPILRARIAARLYLHLTRRSRNAFPLKNGALVTAWNGYTGRIS